MVVHRSAKCANGEVILGQEAKGEIPWCPSDPTNTPLGDLFFEEFPLVK